MRAPLELEFPSDHVLQGLARDIIKHTRADQYLSDRQRGPSDRHGLFEQLLEERLRLASELHDGLLQSLTGAALQLDATLQMLASNPDAARARIREIQELIIERQRELRVFIERVRHPELTHPSLHVDLVVELGKLCDRLSRWGPRVELHHDVADIPGPLADHVYRFVEEGLSNVTRHARARAVRVDVGISNHAVCIVMADDGCGFPFRGRYDLAMLEARGIGPASLKERVASLGGSLVLTSTLSGSTIAIALPFCVAAVPVPRF